MLTALNDKFKGRLQLSALKAIELDLNKKSVQLTKLSSEELRLKIENAINTHAPAIYLQNNTVINKLCRAEIKNIKNS